MAFCSHSRAIPPSMVGPFLPRISDHGSPSSFWRPVGCCTQIPIFYLNFPSSRPPVCRSALEPATLFFISSWRLTRYHSVKRKESLPVRLSPRPPTTTSPPPPLFPNPRRDYPVRRASALLATFSFLGSLSVEKVGIRSREARFLRGLAFPTSFW